MQISSLLLNANVFNKNLRDTLNCVRDIRIQLLGEQPSQVTAKSADREEPACMTDEADLVVHVRDTLHSEIDAELSQIMDALGVRFHPDSKDMEKADSGTSL